MIWERLVGLRPGICRSMWSLHRRARSSRASEGLELMMGSENLSPSLQHRIISKEKFQKDLNIMIYP